MGCIECSDCKKATPVIPECTTNNILLGRMTTGNDYIVRVSNVASGAVTEAVVTPHGSMDLIFALSEFDVDSSFWQSTEGKYKFEAVLASDGSAEAIGDPNAVLDDADCLLVSFTKLDNITGQISLTWT